MKKSLNWKHWENDNLEHQVLQLHENYDRILESRIPETGCQKLARYPGMSKGNLNLGNEFPSNWITKTYFYILTKIYLKNFSTSLLLFCYTADRNSHLSKIYLESPGPELHRMACDKWHFNHYLELSNAALLSWHENDKFLFEI